LDSFDKPQILKTESVGTCQVLSPRNCEERLALGLIDAAVCVGSDGKAVAEIFGAAESVHQGLLLAGARDADALEMLHGALTGARGFLGGDGVGEVAFEIDVLLFCLGRPARSMRRAGRACKP